VFGCGRQKDHSGFLESLSHFVHCVKCYAFSTCFDPDNRLTAYSGALSQLFLAKLEQCSRYPHHLDRIGEGFHRATERLAPAIVNSMFILYQFMDTRIRITYGMTSLLALGNDTR
jgi:hypothetical protein